MVNPLPRLICLENRQLPFHPPDTAEWAEQLYFVPMYNFEFLFVSVLSSMCGANQYNFEFMFVPFLSSMCGANQ